jgi:hypothetical protein
MSTEETTKVKVTRKKSKKSTKGRLLKGMSRKLPIEIFKHPAFKRGLKDLMKGYSGIYALYNGKKLYRIGLTSDLLSRVKTYFKPPHKGKWNQFAIFRIGKAAYLRDIETVILGITDPPGNKVKGRVPKDVDINRLLIKILKDHESLSKEIKKVLKS